MAAFVTQIVLLLIPILGIAYPVLQGIPSLYASLMHHRVSRLYGQLKMLELDMAEGKVTDQDEAVKELDALDARARRLQTGYGMSAWSTPCGAT